MLKKVLLSISFVFSSFSQGIEVVSIQPQRKAMSQDFIRDWRLFDQALGSKLLTVEISPNIRNYNLAQNQSGQIPLLWVLGGHGDYDELFCEGFNREKIANLLGQLQDKRYFFKTIILDTCVSGALIKEFRSLLARNGIMVVNMSSGGLSISRILLDKLNRRELSLERVDFNAVNKILADNAEYEMKSSGLADSIYTYLTTPTTCTRDSIDDKNRLIDKFIRLIRPNVTGLFQRNRSSINTFINKLEKVLKALVAKCGQPIVTETKDILFPIFLEILPPLDKTGIYYKATDTLYYDTEMEEFGELISSFEGTFKDELDQIKVRLSNIKFDDITHLETIFAYPARPLIPFQLGVIEHLLESLDLAEDYLGIRIQAGPSGPAVRPETTVQAIIRRCLVERLVTA